MSIRPEYRRLIDESEKVLNRSNFVTLRSKLELWSEHQDIYEEFLDREVGVEKKIQELSKKYNYSESNINKICYYTKRIV